MVERETVSQVRDAYPWASWAIWDETFPEGDCIERSPDTVAEFIIDRHDELTPDTILLGLNRSDDLDAPFVNFHAPTRNHFDYRLKEFIQDGGLKRLQGAYLTDLVDEIDPESSQVTVTDADAEAFLAQLRLLDECEYHVICFGNKPFEGLCDHFDVDPTAEVHEMRYGETTVDGRLIHLYRVWFYGLYGIYEDKVDVLEKQLQHLNGQVA